MLADSLEWLGHSGFRIAARGRTVYIDPYRVPEGPKADLILVTHGHYDHYSPQDIERLAKGPTRSYASSKRALNQMIYPQLDTQLALEAELQHQLARSDDFIEGVGAFLAKREPSFRGG